MTYNELLQQKEWWLKCNEILTRDRYICKDCGCLGFHNGGNYMKLGCIEDMNPLLREWRFDGKQFSEFYNSIPSSEPNKAEGVVFKEECSDSEVNIYTLSLFRTKCKLFKSILDLPPRIVLVTNREVSTQDATVYYLGHNFKPINPSERYGWGYLIEFNDKVSDDIYVNIEHTIPLAIDGVPYKFDVINIAYDNKLLLLRFSHYSLELRGLNIHHTYYIKGHKPWEYKAEALVTLCENCHKKRHETSSVPYYDHERRLIGNLVVCDRCSGSGYLPQYSHVEDGICFKCGGEGVVLNETF